MQRTSSRKNVHSKWDQEWHMYCLYYSLKVIAYNTSSGHINFSILYLKVKAYFSFTVGHKPNIFQSFIRYANEIKLFEWFISNL